MIDFKVCKYEPVHLEEIVLRDCHTGERPEKVTTEAITYLLDGKPIAIFGAVMPVKGMMDIWGLVSDDVNKAPLSVLKKSLSLLDLYQRKLTLRRITITIKEGYKMGMKWAVALGFECEGLMKCYGPDGSNHFLFARTKWLES